MSVSLKEVFEEASYDFDDKDDLYRVVDMLTEADDLAEEVDERIDDIIKEEEAEEYEPSQAEIDAYLADERYKADKEAEAEAEARLQ